MEAQRSGKQVDGSMDIWREVTHSDISVEVVGHPWTLLSMLFAKLTPGRTLICSTSGRPALPNKRLYPDTEELTLAKVHTGVVMGLETGVLHCLTAPPMTN